jgi:hypothetical protein
LGSKCALDAAFPNETDRTFDFTGSLYTVDVMQSAFERYERKLTKKDCPAPPVEAVQFIILTPQEGTKQTKGMQQIKVE